MGAEFKIDDREFQETLKQYLAVSSRSLPEALNQKMFYIVRGALRALPKVEKPKIEQELVSGYYLQFTKKGKLRSRKQQGRAKNAMATPLVYKIINARRRFAGKPGLNNADMKERAAKFIAARFRSVGTLKAGWWGALATLRKAVNEPIDRPPSSMRIKNPSKANIAKPGFTPSVSVEYNLLAKDEHHQRGIDKRVVETFSGSWFDEMRSMKQHIEDKLSGALKKADSSVRMSGSQARDFISKMLNG